MRRFLLIAVILTGTASGFVPYVGVWAADGAVLGVRANVQDGFIRLVFSGADLPKAEVSDAGADGLTIHFARKVQISGAGQAAGISPATTIKAESDGQSVHVATGAMTRHRTLALGDRLFVDIFTKTVPSEGAAKVEAPKPAAMKAAVPEEPQIEKTEPAAGSSTDSGDAMAAAKAAAAKAAARLAAQQAAQKKDTEIAKPEVKKDLPFKDVPVIKAPESKPDVQAGNETKSLVSDADAPPVEIPASLKKLDAQQKNIEVDTGAAPDLAPDTSAPEKTQQKTDVAVPAPAAEAALAPVNAPATEAAAPVAPFTGQAVITVGSTQGLAMAAFVRQGYLWMVLSQESLSVPPQVSGPDAAALGPIEAVKIDGGSAFRLRLPPGAYVRPEGGGLVWRLYVQGNAPQLKTVMPDRDFADTASGPVVHIPLRNAVSALRLPDPMVGDDLAVVTNSRADNRLDMADSYVDFDILPAIVGAVLRPKADGLRIAVLPSEVTVGRQGGLRITAEGPRAVPKPVTLRQADNAKEAKPTSIFDFKNWALGGPRQYLDMRRSIDDKIAAVPADRKLPEILNGAKFALAQGLPQEAVGFINMAEGYMPALADSGDFQAIKGAVAALTGDTDDAAAAFATPSLQALDEVSLWKAYTAAQAGDMDAADKALNEKGLDLLAGYPARLQTIMFPPLIEAVLTRGDVNVADAMIDAYDRASEQSLVTDRDVVVAYFKGRAAQLRGESDAAVDDFRAAAEGVRGPYPVRATLALVERGTSAKTISREEAVRKLERFRYGWRGDALETQVLERLGLIYVTSGEQRRGLTILREAATLTNDQAQRDKLVAVMQKAFKELYAGKTKEKMTPIEAAAVAADFAELMPPGAEGEQITMSIADQMVAIDLLDRAADMIEPLVGRTANLSDALKYAERGAAIRILNDQPDQALRMIDKALNRPDAQGTALPGDDARRIALLRAKAHAELGRTDDALSELAALPEDKESLGLIADISWKAQRWATAADAFDKLVRAQNLTATRAPTLDQAQLVLNEALALNLAGDTNRLEALRVAYGDIMRRTDLNQPFQLVTRTAQEATLADRDTLLKLVAEVDLFKDVLERFKNNELMKPKAISAPTGQKAAPAPAKADEKVDNTSKPKG